MRKVNPEKARELVRKVLTQNKGNVSKTAKILGISRNRVRGARDGPSKIYHADLKTAPMRLILGWLEELIN